ncbi:hypothetical protein LSTR_LSTR012325 [Laodelphax striatellus]|uniref:Uncharacterized protein n=1 Tax=Laodelphax striatellus TaxID=195883 RepID=A0A482WTM5_LAOST|nr:hypothetical protein LSTR_LSTR012325 [Laodelphax striatellus]
MGGHLYLFSCFFGVLLSTVAAAPKPNNNPTPCHAKDADLDECLVKGAQQIFKNMAKGFKEVGVPKMDPLFVSMMSLHSGDGPVSLNLDLINATHKGLSKSTVTAVEAHPEKYEFEIKLTLPEYNIKGMYNVSGKIMMLPIMGSGPSDITFKNVQAVWKLKGEPSMKNKKTFVKLTDFDVNIDPEKVSVKLDNLFNGNKQLGDTMNKFMNENWQEVFKQLKPVVEESFSQILMELGNRAFNKVSYNQMFTDM